jgi:hypothetical protein
MEIYLAKLSDSETVILQKGEIKPNDCFVEDERNNIYENSGKPIFNTILRCKKIENGWICPFDDDFGKALNPDWCYRILACSYQFDDVPKLIVL